MMLPKFVEAVPRVKEEVPVRVAAVKLGEEPVVRPVISA